jgi:hypothetical protein
MSEASDNRSLATLVSDLTQQASTLLQTESKLFRAEIYEKFVKAGASATEVLAGAICILAALMVLLQALVIALANAGLGAGWSSLLVGVAVAVLGVFLLKNGSAGFSASELQPERTKHQLENDARVLKEQVK